MVPRRIFISYPWVDGGALASRLERDLHSIGHEVWRDNRMTGQLPVWREVEKAILDHDTLICIMTPSAVRPDSYCLREISFAREKKRRVILVLAKPCESRFITHDLYRVDFTEWESDNDYQRACERLFAVLKGGASTLPDTGTARPSKSSQIHPRLKSLDFEFDISKHIPDFTGRKWLFDELEEWISDEQSRVFFITGDPGTGKSAVMAWLACNDARMVLHHFCVAAVEDTVRPLTFVRSIAAQLADKWPLYRKQLATLNADEFDDPDPGTLFRSLLATPAKDLSLGGTLLILVDALDEAFLQPGRNIVRMLGESLGYLPDWMRLVVTSRKEPDILALFRQYRPHEIEAQREDNKRDVRDYLARKLKEQRLASALDAKEVDPTATALLIEEKGAGNFLYVVQALEEIKCGGIDPARPEAFPVSLEGFYLKFFQRVFPDQRDTQDGEPYTSYRPLLDVLCAAREPLTVDEIARFLGKKAFDVRRELARVAVFFPKRKDKYQAYHKSVTDWLTGKVTDYTKYLVDLEHGHQRIAYTCWLEYQNGISGLSPYSLAHLPSHLCEAERWDELETVLTDLRFISARVRAGIVHDLILDYRKALDNLPEGREEKQKTHWRQQRVHRYVSDLLAYSKGKISTLDVISSVNPLSDEAIENDSERIRSTSTRLDRIRVFFRFVYSEAHALARYGDWPCFVFQHAYNSADSGPVPASAEMILDPEKKHLLFLRNQGTRPLFNPHPALLRTLEGHTTTVNAVSATPDGSHAVSGSDDRTVRYWDLETGKCLRTLEGHAMPVTAVSVTPDGQRAVSGSEDRTLRFWDLRTGQCLCTLEGHTNRVNTVSVTPDGCHAISGSDDRTVRYWDLESGKCLRTLEGHAMPVTAVSATPDGQRAVSGSEDCTLRFWDLRTGQCVHTLEGHTMAVNAVSATPDGRHAVSGSNDGTLRFWDLESGKCLRTLEGYSMPVIAVSVTPDGCRAVSGSVDRTVRLWDLETGQCLRTLEGHTRWVHAVSVMPDGRRAISGSDDDMLRLWDLETGKCLRTREAHANDVTAVSVTPDGRNAVSGSEDHSLRFWDLRTGQCLCTLEGHTNRVNTVSVTPDGRNAVSGSEDRSLRFWDLRTGQCLCTLEGHTNRVNTVSVTPDGCHAISGSHDHTLRFWELETGKCLHKLEGHTDRVTAAEVMPDGRNAVSGSGDRTLRYWDLERGKCLRTREAHASDVTAVSVTPDGRKAVSGSEDRSLRYWDLRTGQCLRTLEGHTNRVNTVSVTPDGCHAISGSHDHTLRFWDLQTGQCLAVCRTDSDIHSLELGREGRIVCGTAGGEVIFLTARNLPPAGPAAVSAVRLWHYGPPEARGHWAEHFTTLCLWCGQRFPVPPGLVDLIHVITLAAKLSPDQSPCLELSREAWNEPKLLAECPKCGKLLKFNPFWVDNQDRWSGYIR